MAEPPETLLGTSIKTQGGWFAHLVFGRTGSLVFLHEDGFHFGGGDKEYLIPVPDLMRPAQVVSGWVLPHKALLEAVYAKYPAYAQKSRLRPSQGAA